MQPWWSLLAALVALLAATGFNGCAAASFVVEKGNLRIKSPSAVAGTFDAASGDFGSPMYGGTLVAELVYDDSNALGCEAFRAPLRGRGDLPVVALVLRGACFFVEKAFHAQQADAAGVIVYDHTQEPLITMAVPEEDKKAQKLIPQIRISTLLIQKDVGERLKAQLAGVAGEPVVAELDWREAVTHPDARVEWDLWFSANQGTRGSAATFLQEFHDTAISLERPGYTQFTPHIMLRKCYGSPLDCTRPCIRHGRYCAINAVPEEWETRYSGAQVVEEGLRTLCVHRRLNDTQQAWKWWGFTTRFLSVCTMDASRFDRPCAEAQMRAVGMSQEDVAAVQVCVGMMDEDSSLPLLEDEMRQQWDDGGSGRGAIVLLPTLVINDNQYRGRLASAEVLRALCAGFSEGQEPGLCLAGGLDVDECAAGTDDCWREGGGSGTSACVDTFRGYMCPPGWQGDGKQCEDIDECALGISGCDQECINTPGSYRCTCKSGFTLHGGNGVPGICLPSALAGGSRIPAWLIALVVLLSAGCAVAVGMASYRLKLRRDMQTEMRALLREYMPLAQADPELRRTLIDKEGPAHAGGGPTQELSDLEGQRGPGGSAFTPRTPGAAGDRSFAPPSITELTHQYSPPRGPL